MNVFQFMILGIIAIVAYYFGKHDGRQGWHVLSDKEREKREQAELDERDRELFG